VSVIAPLNEPAGFKPEILPATRQFWLDSYESIRRPYGNAEESNTLVLLGDAFQGAGYWQGFMTGPNYAGVAMDVHLYQVFTDGEIGRTEQQHITAACGAKQEVAGFDKPVIVGEWTPAMTDCAKYLNGRGFGARYDGTFPGSKKVGTCLGITGKAATFSDEYKAFLRKTWEAQVITYEKGQGWMQWTWKTEVADEWAYQAGLVNGWIPKNPTDLMYPNICG